MPIRNVKMDDRRKHHHFLTSKHGSSSPSLVPIMSSFIFDDILACHSPPTNFYTDHGAEYEHCRGWGEAWSPDLQMVTPPSYTSCENSAQQLAGKSVAQSNFTRITFHSFLDYWPQYYWTEGFIILEANHCTRQFSPVTDYLT